jgi:hypothetical protein
MVDCLNILGFTARADGRLAHAADCFREAVDLSQRIDKPAAVAVALIGLAGLAADREDVRRAARLLGMATALREPNQTGSPPEDDCYEQEAVRLEAALGEPAFNTAWTAGKNVPPDMVLSEVLDPHTT